MRHGHAPRTDQPARSRCGRATRRHGGGEQPGGLRQHPRAVSLGLSLEGRAAARRGAPDAHQDDYGALCRARAGAARWPSVRTPGDHRGPSRARTAGLSRLGRRRNQSLNRLLVLIALLVCAGAAGAADLLEPEQAFRFSARAADAGSVEVRFAIAEGYYLYRDRLRFSAEGAWLGEP